MTHTPTVAADVLDVPLDPAVQERLDRIGLPALVVEHTQADWARIAPRTGDPMAADSRANYAAWLRRQASAWTAVGLPAVRVAALDWPLASVRPQCLDVVGLIVADLRELSPRTRPTVIPAQPGHRDVVPPGTIVAAAVLCVRVAEQSVRLLPPAQALTAGLTATGPATRYLTRCADLADRSAGLQQEVAGWAAGADRTAVHQAVLAAARFTARLADALEAATRTGW